MALIMIKRLNVIRRMLSEAQKAQDAVIPKEGEPTIFDKIISKEIPSEIVFEDEKVLAFRDINPQAPKHIVLIPKVRGKLTHLAVAAESDKPILGHLMWAAAEIARREQLHDGWRLVVNSGRNAAQSVYHLHVHIIGGRQMGWPPG